ncbi:unnamed protein product [Cuscuta epithymum]|uniref:Uncharacterized protein n=1 Tax=Cuscuta epithymum TaxID=186058 RepID=A0AAV0FA63_9ASTE|nr:unnamed protein product [Cuscuta epithymum]
MKRLIQSLAWYSKIFEGIEFYKKYAAVCGFDSHIGSKPKDRGRRTHTVIWKYVVRNRQGFKNVAKGNPPEISHAPVVSPVCTAFFILLLIILPVEQVTGNLN